MNTIGLLGGMSWESTAIYYRLINQLARFQRGRLHSAPLLIWSADFEDIRRLQVAGEWYKTAEILAAAACQLERAGARLLLLCTNTMHKVAAEIEAAVSIPLIPSIIQSRRITSGLTSSVRISASSPSPVLVTS